MDPSSLPPSDRAPPPAPLRIALIGHVEHVTLGRVDALPGPGEIAHVAAPRAFAGGGGGIALFQLLRGPAEVHAYTAIGNDDGGAFVADALRASRAVVHAAARAEPHTRDVVLITPDGERAVIVVGPPLQPRRDDPLPWDALAGFDAVYFTAEDPDALRAARAARVLVVSARRRTALVRSGVRADVVVGSAHDPREAVAFGDFAVPPGALVLTEGAAGGRVATASGATRFAATPAPVPRGGAYGAGDSFAGALAYYLAAGLSPARAAARAAPHGAAVLRGFYPLENQRALDPAPQDGSDPAK